MICSSSEGIHSKSCANSFSLSSTRSDQKVSRLIFQTLITNYFCLFSFIPFKVFSLPSYTLLVTAFSLWEIASFEIIYNSSSDVCFIVSVASKLPFPLSVKVSLEATVAILGPIATKSVFICVSWNIYKSVPKRNKLY